MTVTRTLPEAVVQGKRLGRHIRHDPRSLNHPAETATTLTSVKHASAGLPLDQGDVGSCTAEALCGALNSVPHWKPGNPTLSQADAYKLYGLETRLEGQPYPPNDPGGSGLEVCVAAKQMGWLNAYQHAIGIEQALLALVVRPVITGVDWYTSFDTPDSNGLVVIAPDATVRGGHEIVADELVVPQGVTLANLASNLDRVLVGLWQSWGPGFGLRGRFFWSAATWDTLLRQGGDVTIPRTALGWKA